MSEHRYKKGDLVWYKNKVYTLEDGLGPYSMAGVVWLEPLPDDPDEYFVRSAPAKEIRPYPAIDYMKDHKK